MQSSGSQTDEKKPKPSTSLVYHMVFEASKYVLHYCSKLTNIESYAKKPFKIKRHLIISFEEIFHSNSESKIMKSWREKINLKYDHLLTWSLNVSQKTTSGAIQ